MKPNIIVTVGSLILVALISSLITWRFCSQSTPMEPVFVIGAVSVTDSARLGDYQRLAQPLAYEAGGYLPLAFGKPQMLEGESPAAGLFFVERFDSREALEKFLSSMQRSEVKALRDEAVDVNFMLAVPRYKRAGG